MKHPLDHAPLAAAFVAITALLLVIGFAIARDRDASEAENAKRLSAEGVAARAGRHRQEHVAHTEQGKRNG